MASLAERAAAAKAAKAAQGVVQAAPTVQAAVVPPPPPAPAPAAAGTAPRREEPKRAPKPQGGGAPRRETKPAPAAPAQDERVRQIAARDIFDSRKAGSIEPKLGRGTPTPGPIAASPESLRARFAGSDLEAMVDATTEEKSLLTPADRAAALTKRQELLDAMQRVAELRASRGSPMTRLMGPRMIQAGTTERGLAATRPTGEFRATGTPVPVSALQGVAAFRDEVRKRGDDYRAVSRGLAGLEAKAIELEAKSPRLPGVPVSPTLAAVDQVRKDYRKLVARRRADLAEAGLTDEQIDELGR